MASQYDFVKLKLEKEPNVWLVTGAAGFIGSNLVETLLKLNQKVIGLDNFSTGHYENINEVKHLVSTDQWSNFTLISGDIRELDQCRHACIGVDYVLHQAALGSVPRSIENPILTNENNVSGFLNMLVAARDSNVKSFVYAASSSTYGDHPGLPKIESKIGNPLSPYAVTKYVNELYAQVFARCFEFKTIGLRYFNVFGPRQDPNGAYAAVIPKWISSMISGDVVYINGTGETSRDFCYIDNAVQANILAATTENPNAQNQVFNVALNDRTSLNDLFEKIRAILLPSFPALANIKPSYRDFRQGDVLHSLADIQKITELLGYSPTHKVHDGLIKAMPWYLNTVLNTKTPKAKAETI